MARIPHGQPNQAFPSSSCSVILVTFPPPPRLFLSLPAVTARSLSFQMFRHACRLASIRILRKQTKEPRRLRETARETTSSEPNSCNISQSLPEGYGFSLPATSYEIGRLRQTTRSYKRGERACFPLGVNGCQVKRGFSCLSEFESPLYTIYGLKSGGIKISGERHSEKVCNSKRSLSSCQQRVPSQQRSSAFQATPIFVHSDSRVLN